MTVKVFNTDTFDTLASVIATQQRIVYAQCISSFSDKPLRDFKFAKTSLNEDNTPDAIVQYMEGDSCGTAGCMYELCISKDGHYVHVPFGYTAKSIAVEDTKTNGMHDLMLNDDRSLKMNWNGSKYVLSAF